MSTEELGERAVEMATEEGRGSCRDVNRRIGRGSCGDVNGRRERGLWRCQREKRVCRGQLCMENHQLTQKRHRPLTISSQTDSLNGLTAMPG